MGLLNNKTALISGAGRGIGRATAELFAKEGADLILIARSEDELVEVKNLCEVKGAKALIKTVDLSDLKQIDKLFDEIDNEFETIDVLVNNAAMFDAGAINDYSTSKLSDMLSVNLFASLYLSQKTIKKIDRNKGGAIVNVSSLSGCFGVEKFPSFGAYNISKYALWGLTEIMALENKDNNIRVNQVSPGGVDTRMFREAVPPGVEPSLKPIDVAEKILYLASAQSGSLTGENVLLTGD